MQQGPQGYGPPPGYPQQGGYAPQQGYPQQPPPKQGMSTFAKIMIVLLVLGVTSVGGCLVCVGVGAKAVDDANKKQKADVQAAKDAPAADVPIATLLSEYKGNEVRADGLYKDKNIRVTGTVDDVKKGLGGGMYVTLGTGKQFEIPQVQCQLDDSDTNKAAALKKGAKVTVAGKVTGLLLNVQLDPCSIK